MGVLHNPRHEQFARLVAAGQRPPQAYTAAGYQSSTAYTCGPRLLKKPAVQARVAELGEAAATSSVTGAAIDREFVLAQLKDNALKAKQECQWAASNRALELLGKELGIFVDRRLPWDGDPTTLTDSQLDELMGYFEKLAYPQTAGETRRLGLEDHKLVIEASAVPTMKSIA